MDVLPPWGLTEFKSKGLSKLTINTIDPFAPSLFPKATNGACY